MFGCSNAPCMTFGVEIEFTNKTTNSTMQNVDCRGVYSKYYPTMCSCQLVALLLLLYVSHRQMCTNVFRDAPYTCAQLRFASQKQNYAVGTRSILWVGSCYSSRQWRKSIIQPGTFRAIQRLKPSNDRFMLKLVLPARHGYFWAERSKLGSSAASMSCFPIVLASLQQRHA